MNELGMIGQLYHTSSSFWSIYCVYLLLQSRHNLSSAATDGGYVMHRLCCFECCIFENEVTGSRRSGTWSFEIHNRALKLGNRLFLGTSNKLLHLPRYLSSVPWGRGKVQFSKLTVMPGNRFAFIPTTKQL